MSEEQIPKRVADHEGQTGSVQDDERWLDRPGSVDLIIKVLIGVSALTVVADLFYHKHADHDFQEWFGFDALYGFVACVGLVLAAKVLRKLLMRSEDYYD